MKKLSTLAIATTFGIFSLGTHAAENFAGFTWGESTVNTDRSSSLKQNMDGKNRFDDVIKNSGTWGVRAGAFQVARRVNALFMDPAITRAWQVIGQVDRFTEIGGRPGAVRLIYGASRSRQSQWGELFRNGFETFDRNPSGYRLKHMLALNIEQELTDDLGAFARLSWNDGRTQNWMFTEMDRAVSVGLSLRGLRWGRPADTAGLAALARRLESVPGIGPWTTAEALQRSHGAADLVSVGDYHLAQYVGQVLTGRRTDDAGMLRLLAPWAGHRQRVVRMIGLSGERKQAFGPKLAPADHRAH